MVREVMTAAASAAILAFSSTAFAQQRSQFGTSDEAKAMLSKTVAAVKADKTKTLDPINKGEGGLAFARAWLLGRPTPPTLRRQV
jgi:hypothetical protein